MPKPSRIIIVRHGQSEANVDPRLNATKPDHRMELTPLGREQARVAGRAIRALVGEGRVAVYSSPYYRTRQTRDEILASFAPDQVHALREDPRLREQEFGNYLSPEEWARTDVHRRAFGMFFYRPPTGESGADVFDRCTGVLDTLHRDFAKPDYPSNVLIVCHGLTIRLLLMRWFHWSVEEFEAKANPANAQHFVLQLGADDRYALTEPFPLRAR